jgi:hypothetical protein
MGKTILAKLESLAYFLQFSKMKRKITNETIEKRRIFFHPDLKKDRILSEYKKRLVKLNIEK